MRCVNHVIKSTLLGLCLLFIATEVAFTMGLDETFQRISTLVISSSPSEKSQGTAFFYSHLAPTDKKGPQWREVTGMWLVTNRHVVLPRIKGKEVMPTTFTFHWRKKEGDLLKWEPCVISTAELNKRLKLHANPIVDLAMINLEGLDERLKKNDIIPPYFVHPEQFAGLDNIIIEASSDVLVVGYPGGYYDNVNLYPIIKSGIVSSRWGQFFNGKPHFLIDAKLFPGSSGSIVISKPTHIAFKDGKMMYSNDKKFAFLGVYSGEPFRHERPIDLDDMLIIKKSGYDVGIVWYANLLEEIINGGVSFQDGVVQ